MSNKQKEKIFDIVVLAMFVVAGIYVVVQTILRNNEELSFKLTLGVWILAVVIVMDFVEPLLTGKFDNVSRSKALLHCGFGFCSAAAWVCLYVFIINVRYVKEPVHYIFLGVSALLFFGRFVLKGIIEEFPDAPIDNSVKADEGIEVNIDEEDIEINTLSLDDEAELTVKVFKNRSK